MAEYIEREKVTELIDYFQEDYFEAEAYYGLLKEDFMQLPSADVAPVVHGQWKWSEGGQCSECGFHNSNFGYNYCPNCGARMDGENNG